MVTRFQLPERVPRPDATSPIGTSSVAPNLRDAEMADVPAMAAIELAAFSDPWPASAFLELMQASHARIRVVIAPDGRLQGYCVLLSAADEGEIANIAVALSARRHGVAGALLDDALDFAMHSALESVYLEVRVSNDAARALYASRQFVPVGRRRAYYRYPLEDALVLRWSRHTVAPQ